jgi:hypothetical protein
LHSNKLLTKEGGKALAQALAGNSALKELDISNNNWLENPSHPEGLKWMGDGPGFVQELTVGIKDNEAMSKLNLSNNRLGAEAFMVSTELYLEEKLVTTSVADWAPTPHQSLPSDRLEIVSANPPLADSDITNVVEVPGKAVMVSRGGCSFVIKAQRIQAAGAMAMVCVNNDELNPNEVYRMGGEDRAWENTKHGSAWENITIPVVMVSFNTGAQIRAMAEMAVTIKKSFSLTDALKNHK